MKLPPAPLDVNVAPIKHESSSRSTSSVSPSTKTKKGKGNTLGGNGKKKQKNAPLNKEHEPTKDQRTYTIICYDFLHTDYYEA